MPKSQVDVQLKWLGKKFERNVVLTLEERTVITTRMYADKVRENISVPVLDTGTEVIRSKPGEYPRLESGDLRRSIKQRVVKRRGQIWGEVWTELDYGLVLEYSKRLDRSFIERTWEEIWPKMEKILMGRIV